MYAKGELAGEYVAKVFDLIHKVNNTEPNDEPEESRIPFDDQNEQGERPKKKRLKVEIAFFYVLLFIVFFLIGAHFVSPNLFAGFLTERDASASPPPETANGPQAGLTIEKEGESIAESREALNIASPTPSPEKKPEQPVKTETSAAAPQTARVQILNGTNRTGAAAALRTKLANNGISVASIGNYRKRNVQRTTVFYHPDYESVAKQIHAVTGGILADTTTGIGNYNVLVVIGLSS